MFVAETVDTDALLQTVWSSFAGALGLMVFFALVIVGAARAQEAREAGANGMALAYGLLGVAALLLVIGLIVIGIVAMVSKE